MWYFFFLRSSQTLKEKLKFKWNHFVFSRLTSYSANNDCSTHTGWFDLSEKAQIIFLNIGAECMLGSQTSVLVQIRRNYRQQEVVNFFQVCNMVLWRGSAFESLRLHLLHWCFPSLFRHESECHCWTVNTGEWLCERSM